MYNGPLTKIDDRSFPIKIKLVIILNINVGMLIIQNNRAFEIAP